MKSSLVLLRRSYAGLSESRYPPSILYKDKTNYTARTRAGILEGFLDGHYKTEYEHLTFLRAEASWYRIPEAYIDQILRYHFRNI